jgi:branched-subunit amino acid aminotransferase/4-amino-4-deoxychorismate lyase
MIWIRGEVVPDDALRIGALDRTFEHGLGLFETFRTWDGHATLLQRHLDRMRRSARELGLVLDPDDLPDEEAVGQIRRAGFAHRSEAPAGGQSPPYERDIRLRIVLSGGVPGAGRATDKSTVWMTAGPLPPPMPTEGARIVRSILADPDDPLARHKTLNYWRRRIEQARAAAEGADEVLCVTPDGRICEGTRSNLFLIRGGQLITSGADGPLLDGIMRRVVIERARQGGVDVIEGPVPLDAIGTADEAFLTNSVRGMLPVSRLLHAGLPAPGPVTQRLWDRILAWLNSGGTTR